MFAYCNNNPISNQDSTGELAITAIILIGSAIIGFAFAGYTAYKETKAGYDTADIVFDSIANGLCAFCSVYTLGMSTYECYLNFCALNAITPVTEVGASSQHVQTQNPLENITYTKKVQEQMDNSDDAFHAFPQIVDNYGTYGNLTTIKGNDSMTYVKLSIQGAFRGYEGNFVYIWNQNMQCNHRFFEIK